MPARRRITTAVVVALTLAGLVTAFGLPASAGGNASLPQSADARRGLVYDGLAPGADNSKCHRAYEAHTSDGATYCTHGPDAAPLNVIDVRNPRSASDLGQSTQNDQAASLDGGTNSSGSALLPCYGDGTSGPRVQAVYAHASDVTDRFSSIATLIQQWAANADNVFDASAAETGGIRHVRFVTTNCQLAITDVQLPTTGDDTFSNTINALKTQGFNRTDRKYLIWTDANVYCGIATVTGDDQPGSANANNNGPSFARVDTGCWGLTNPTEAHELMHNLGGVQLSAPHSSGGWHCTDEYDRMCYQDSSTVTMTYVCPSSHEHNFDCNHDDYYNTAPAAGSYLATHWDSTNNVFLAPVAPDSWYDPSGGTTPSPSPSPSTTPTPSPSTSPTPSPTPSTSPTPSPSPSTSPTPAPTPGPTTVTYSGSFNKKQTSRSYSVSAGTGTLTATVTVSRGTTMSMTVTDASGKVVAQGSSNSTFSLSAPVTTGSYTVTVSGTGGSFTLTVTYPSAG